MTPKSTPVKALPFSPSQVGFVFFLDGSIGGAVIPKRQSANLCHVIIPVPQYVDQARLSWPREPFADLHTSVQPEGRTKHATAEGQDPPHPERELCVSYTHYLKLLSI